MKTKSNIIWNKKTNIVKVILVFLMLFMSLNTFANTWNTEDVLTNTGTWTTQTNQELIQNQEDLFKKEIEDVKSDTKNPLEDLIKIKKEQVQTLIQPDEITKKIEDNEKKKEEIIKQKEIYEKLNQNLSLEIQKIKDAIANNNLLVSKIEKTKQNVKEKEKELSKLKRENNELQNKLKSLLELQKENGILKDKYDKLLINYDLILSELRNTKTIVNQEKEETIKEKKQIVLLVTFFYFLFLLVLFLIQTDKIKLKKKDNAFLSFLQVSISIFYVAFLIWAIFYIHPELTALFFLAIWWIIALNANIIGSLIQSPFIIFKFKVWDIISYKNRNDKIVWKISKISILWTEIKEIDEEGFETGAIDYIFHRTLLNDKIRKIPIKDIEYYKYELIVHKDFVKDIFILISNIQEALEKNLYVKEDNKTIIELKHEFLDNWNVVIKIIFLVKRERIERIKNIILSEYTKIINMKEKEKEEKENKDK